MKYLILTILLLLTGCSQQLGVKDAEKIERTPAQISHIEEQAQEIFDGNYNKVNQIVFDKMKPSKIKLKGNDWEFTGMNFKTLIKENAEDGWEYEENGKKLGFESKGMSWDGNKIKTKADKVKGEIKEREVKYKDALGSGIDIKIVQGNYSFQKIIEIESLESLGEIPDGTEYLEFSFKLSGDFNLPEGKITDRIPFGEDSFLLPVRAWDGSNPEDEIQSGAFGEIKNKVLTKKIPIAWLKQATFPVKTDATITFGSEYVFNSANLENLSVATLDGTHFVVAYQDYGNSGYGTAIVGTISGTNISYGSANVFYSGGTYRTDVAGLDSTHFVVVYKGAGGAGTANIGVVSGNTISSYGADAVFDTSSTNYLSVSKLDSTHFVVGYRDDGESSYGKAKFGTVATTTISYGAEATFNSATADWIDVAGLDSTHFVVAYKDTGGDTYGHCKFGTVSTTTITYGAEATFNSATADWISVAGLDSTHFVVAYKDTGGDNYGICRFGTVTGTNISYGAEAEFLSASLPDFISVFSLDSTRFIISYKDNSASPSEGYCRYGTIDGTTITYEDAVIFNSGSYVNNVVSASLDAENFVVAYRDGGNSNYGTAIVGNSPAPANTGAFFQLF